MDPIPILAVNLTSTFIYAGIIIVLLIFSGFFSKSETVFSSVSKAKLMTLIDENKKGARKALWLAENFEKVLSVLLTGNNLVNIAISTLGLRVFLGLFQSESSWVDVVNTAVMTIIVLIFGEILPKTQGRANPEKNALRLSGILYVVVKILYPIAYPFYIMNHLALDKMKVESNDSVSSDDLENIIDNMEDSGQIESEEADMLQNVLDLNESEIKTIMTPRVDCMALSIDTPIEEIKKCFFENQYSRVPVYKGTIDHIVGVLFEKDFFKAYIENPKIKSMKGLLQKPLFVVGSMTVDDLLTLLKKKNVHLAIVLDEFGGFDGVVTMEDCIEEVVGEIFDEHDEIPFTIEKISENKYMVSGDLEVDALYEELGIEDEEENDFTTVGGMVQDALERLPVVGDKVEIKVVSRVLYDEISSSDGIEYKNLDFTVTEIKLNRITKLELEVSVVENEPSGNVETKEENDHKDDTDEQKEEK